MKKLVLFLIFSFASYFAVAQEKKAKDYLINIGTQKINLQQVDRQALAREENIFAGRCYALLQFNDLPTETQKQTLQAAGVSLHDYVPNYAYMASLPSNFSNFEILQQNGVRNLAALQPNFKYSQTEVATLQSNEKQKFQVLLFPNLDSLLVTKYYEQKNIQLKKYYKQLNIIEIETTKDKLPIYLAPFVQYATVATSPQLLNLLYGKNNGRSGILVNGARNLTGKGVSIASWDGSPSGQHIDFVNRYVYGETPDNYAAWHGTHTTGTMAGAGNRDPFAQGMAPEASIVGYTLTTGEFIPYEMLRAVQDYGITITQNSYGDYNICSQGGAVYNMDDRARDQLAALYPNLLHVFAIGNSQTACAGFLTTAGNAGKNMITVGAVTPTDDMTHFSSWGPTRDGRIKPDITAVGGYNIYSTQPNEGYQANGFWGTSFACPVVSGIAAQLSQRYKQLNANQNPRASLIKAVLCNGATDLGNANVDYKFGFGRVNALNAVTALEENRYRVESVAQGQTKTYNVTVPAGVSEIKVLLAWTDVPSIITAGQALVNDLNLQVSDGTTTYNTWVLNPASPNSVATRGIDNLNNIEQVTIQTPAAGNYQITVNGAAIPAGGQQEFSLTWQIDQPKIKVVFPAGGEKLRSTVGYTIYWDAVGTNSTSTVEYSTDNGTNWNLIANNIPNGTNLVSWAIPAGLSTHQGLVRVTNGSLSNVSETNFSLLNVPDIISLVPSNNSIDLTWTSSTAATNYDVMTLNWQTGQWEVFANTTATNYMLTNLVNGQTYWLAVRPRTSTIIGERSFAHPIAPSGAGTPIDLQLTALPAPTQTACTRTNAENITISIKNNGTNPILANTILPVSYQINLQTPVNENFTLLADLAAGASVNYTFAQTADLSAFGTYNIAASVNFMADNIIGNNKLNTSIVHTAPILPIITGNLNICNSNPTTLTAEVPISVYDISNIAFSPINMDAASSLNLGDDAVSPALALGFSFNFFGKPYTNIFVSSNGVVGFTEFGLEYSPSTLAIPSAAALPNNFIALALCDLAPNLGGTIKYLRTGTAPNRKFVVDYANVPIFENPTPTAFVTMQVVINENGTIEMHNTNIQTGTQNKIMGLENETGRAGTAVSGRNLALWAATNEGLRFSPALPPILWQPNGETTPSISTNVAGVYTVSYTQNSCTYSQTATLVNYCTPLAITNFAPTSGGVDTQVTITGTNFTGATAVTIGGVAARSYTVVNATTITAVVGDGFSTGLVQVTQGTTVTSAALGTPNFTRTSCANTISITSAVASVDGNGFGGFDVVWNLGAGTYTAINVFYQPQTGAGSTYYTRRTFAGNATSGRLWTVNSTSLAYNIYIQGVCNGNAERVSTTANTGLTGNSCSIIDLAPTPLTVTNTDITFTWNTVQNAYLYQPIYQECDAAGNRVAGGGQTGTAYLTPAMIATQSWTVSQLKPNTFYRFAVRVHCLQGNSNLISPYSLYPFIQTGGSGTACLAPSPTLGSAGMTNGYASQVINWAAVPSATNGYGIYFRENSQSDWTAYHLGNVLTYNISGLKQGATYTYFVYGACSNGQAPRSAEQTFTVVNSAPLDCVAATPTTSTGISTNPVGATLSWTTTPNAVQAGKLYGIVYSQVSTPGTTYVVYTDNVSQTLSAGTHPGIVANTNYAYRLQTFCDSRLQWVNNSGTFNVPVPSGAERNFDTQIVENFSSGLGLQVYPNPANAEVTISAPQTNTGGVSAELVILDMLGREVYKTNNFSGNLTLNTKAFASGTYLVKVNEEGKVMTKKLVVE